MWQKHVPTHILFWQYKHVALVRTASGGRVGCALTASVAPPAPSRAALIRMGTAARSTCSAGTPVRLVCGQPDNHGAGERGCWRRAGQCCSRQSASGHSTGRSTSMLVPPPYFHPVRQHARKGWDALQAGLAFGRPFSPRRVEQRQVATASSAPRNAQLGWVTISVPRPTRSPAPHAIHR